MVQHLVALSDPSVSEPSILIVDDDVRALEALEHILKAGYGVRVAPDAPSAFLEVEAAVLAAVVLDLYLPIIDGLEVLRRLRATDKYADIPVAVVTGDYLVDERVKRELQPLGAQLYFKPLWQEDLIRIVRGLLPGTR